MQKKFVFAFYTPLHNSVMQSFCLWLGSFITGITAWQTCKPFLRLVLEHAILAWFDKTVFEAISEYLDVFIMTVIITDQIFSW